MEKEELLKVYKKYEKKFIEKECSNCQGTKLQRDRECGKLGGFKDLGCEFMVDIITTKMQILNRGFIIKNYGKDKSPSGLI